MQSQIGQKHQCQRIEFLCFPTWLVAAIGNHRFCNNVACVVLICTCQIQNNVHAHMCTLTCRFTCLHSHMHMLVLTCICTDMHMCTCTCQIQNNVAMDRRTWLWVQCMHAQAQQFCSKCNPNQFCSNFALGRALLSQSKAWSQHGWPIQSQHNLWKCAAGSSCQSKAWSQSKSAQFMEMC